ncbi:thioredoxin domain-containing protein [bacterium]|nr:thioredoxin domain-containing protein [bacterium]
MNRLNKENSPYLQQHANNPVNWMPWGEEALNLAKKENKPIFLSVGYAACHWCHVMAHESFESETIAEILNKNFIAIKVDREERPDIDSYYIDYCQKTTGGAGWPLSVFLHSNRKPFFAGTYFPKTSFKSILLQISEIWRSEKEKIEQVIEQQSFMSYQTSNSKMLEYQDILSKTEEFFYKTFDVLNKGSKGAPKFPVFHEWSYLLRTQKQNNIDMALETAKKIRLSGIYDQIGFGVHRYATDKEWNIPHFEKMLYDQAGMIELFTECWRVTKDDFFKNTVEEINQFLKRELQTPNGVFYSAIDADSNGSEGDFYVWDYEELEIFFKSDFNILEEHFYIPKNGNFDGKIVLSLKKIGVPNSLIEKLKLFREKRVKPSIDTKIITEWNCMIAKSYAYAGLYFDNAEYLHIAKKIIENFDIDSLYRTDSNKIPAFLDDYLYLGEAYLALYEATFLYDYLEKSIKVANIIADRFYDNGLFYLTEKDKTETPEATIVMHDGAYPSGFNGSIRFFAKLGTLIGDLKLLDISKNAFKQVLQEFERYPLGYTTAVESVYYFIEGVETLKIMFESDDSYFETPNKKEIDIFNFEKIKQNRVQYYNPFHQILYISSDNPNRANFGFPENKNSFTQICTHENCQIVI